MADRRFFPRPRMVELLGNRVFRLVGEEYQPSGVLSLSGALLREPIHLLDVPSGSTVYLGRGEVDRYLELRADGTLRSRFS